MKYGDRLKAARTHAGITQAALAAKIGNISQANISHLETSSGNGSEYTVQFAIECGVSPLWLATGKGEMLGNYTTSDEMVRRLMIIMEPQPEYAKQHILKEAAEAIELVKRATAASEQRDPINHRNGSEK